MELASRGMFGRRLYLDELGVRSGRTLLAWDAIEHYIYDWSDLSLRADVILVSKSHRSLRLSPIFDHWEVCVDRVIAKLHPRLALDPWFGAFTVEADALVHERAGRLPFAEIQTVTVDAIGDSAVVVVAARAGIEWMVSHVDQIPNVWLWLDVLASHGVPVRTLIALDLPPMLSALEARLRHHAALPAATLVRR